MAQNPGSSEKSERVIEIDVSPELSLEDIDEALAEEDPDFLAKIGEIAADKTLTMAELILNDDQQALDDEKARWSRLGKVGRTLSQVIPFLPILTLKIRKTGRVASDRLTAGKIHLANFVYYIRTVGFAKAKAQLVEFRVSTQEGVGSWQKFIGRLPLWRKLLFLTTILLTVFTALFVYRVSTKGIVLQGEELFITSLETVADKVYDYDPVTESEPFYENLKGESNLLLIQKMVVNIKKSKNSGPGPMAAFEFYIEGYAPEAIIEFKDREVEFRDLVQRSIEEFTFDQLESGEGKRELCLRLQKVINSKLSTAQLKKVFIKTAIIKP